jgi:tetratricopeptide (TPR) repeat protein
MGKMMRRFQCLIVLSGCLLAFPICAEEEAPLSGAAYTLAEKAYAALSKGDVDEAGRAVDEALHEQPKSHQLNFLRLNIFMRKDDLSSAQKLANDLVGLFPNDAQVLVQRGYVEQRRKLYQEAMNDFYAALSLPTGMKDAAQQRQVRLSWADCALLSHQPKVALDALAPYATESDAAVQLRLANAHWTVGEREATHRSAELAEKAAGSDGERDAAHQLWVTSGPLSDLDQAYVKLQAKNDIEAVRLFKSAFAKTPGNVYQYIDAGYAAKRINDTASEVEWFSRALDADALSQSHVLDDQQRFNYRRNNEETDRSFGAVASLVYQGNGIGPLNNFNVVQTGVEAYWRPEGEGNRNGKLFNVFVRGFENVWDGAGGAVGEQTVQGDVGVRYKPLSDFNVILVADRLFRIGITALDDWVLRFAYSDGSGGDLNAAQKSWPAWSIYTDGSYFTTTPQYIQTYEARYGRSWRLDSLNDRVSFTPHLVVSGDYESLAAQPSSLGYGPGISMRGWFREDAHHAPASWLDLTVQYRFEVTQTNRAHGLGVRATLLY